MGTDPQESALLWSRRGPGPPFTVISAPARDVHERLAGPGAWYAHMIAGTPPGDLGIIPGAVMAAGTVIVPVTKTGLDRNRMRACY